MPKVPKINVKQRTAERREKRTSEPQNIECRMSKDRIASLNHFYKIMKSNAIFMKFHTRFQSTEDK